jgi:hypothetical protein
MTHCYSQRMLNPYHGLVNVVEVPGADAVSRDGLNWTLYIQGGSEAEPMEDGSLQQVRLPDIKFGTWSARCGLRRAPVRLVTDYEKLDRAGNRLLKALKDSVHALPFAQRDLWELWLLDRQQGLPLGLLESACHRADRYPDAPRSWTPGQRARATFAHPETGDQAAERLARQVNDAAGSVCWFLRAEDGSGREPDAGTAFPRQLPPDAFPELLLREQWPRQAETELVRAYLAWQAPWLLALQHVSRATRARLEAWACRQALLLEELFPTYPEILDPARIRVARVEAALRRSADKGSAAGAPDGSAFFVTGN